MGTKRDERKQGLFELRFSVFCTAVLRVVVLHVSFISLTICFGDLYCSSFGESLWGLSFNDAL